MPKVAQLKHGRARIQSDHLPLEPIFSATVPYRLKGGIEAAGVERSSHTLRAQQTLPKRAEGDDDTGIVEKEIT